MSATATGGAATTGGAAETAGAGADIETIVQMIVVTAESGGASGKKKKLLLVRQEFEPVEPTTNDMLQWEDSKHKYAEIQELPGGLARIGTVGDGNCLLHSFLFALSPTYRSHNKAARSYIADEFRNILVARADELQTMADTVYFEIGGAAALEENFEILEGAREEINIEMAPLIAQLFGFNLLAVQVRADMSLHPVCATYIAYNPLLPTVLVNYIGGGLDIGNVGEGFQQGGHYEAIFAPIIVPAEVAAAGASATSRRKKTEEPRVALDNVRTRYIFRHSEIGELLAQFAIACRPEMSAEAAALMSEIAKRNASAIKRTSSNRSTRKRTGSSSNRTTKGRTETRKRTSSGSKKKKTTSE